MVVLVLRHAGTGPDLRQSVGVDSDAIAMRASVDDPERFAPIFERNYRVVWTYLVRLAGPNIADEVSAEVFLTAFARRSHFDSERGEVRSWLYGIASNMLRTRLRSEGRARRAFARAAAVAVTEEPDPTDLVDDADQIAGEEEVLRRALEQLRRDDREVLVLFAWEERSYAQIAETLGIPIGTVRSRMSRARGRLRELLGDTGQLLVEPNPREAP